MPSSVFIPSLSQPATHVPVTPGTQIVVRGALYSKHDGSIVDAATTTWPAGAPGGRSVDAGGLFDFEAGGFHVVARDPASHVVKAVATGRDAPACPQHGVSAPCLPLRLAHQAHARLLTADEWAASLQGRIQVETLAPPPPPPITARLVWLAPLAQAVGFAAALAALAMVVLVLYRRRRCSPRGELLALLRRVRGRVSKLDPVLSSTLAPAFEATGRAVRKRTFDAASADGRRVAHTFRELDAELTHAAQRRRATRERQAADELIREVRVALEAAQETARTCEPLEFATTSELTNRWPPAEGARHEAQASCPSQI